MEVSHPGWWPDTHTAQFFADRDHSMAGHRVSFLGHCEFLPCLESVPVEGERGAAIWMTEDMNTTVMGVFGACICRMTQPDIVGVTTKFSFSFVYSSAIITCFFSISSNCSSLSASAKIINSVARPIRFQFGTMVYLSIIPSFCMPRMWYAAEFPSLNYSNLASCVLVILLFSNKVRKYIRRFHLNVKIPIIL